MMSLIDVTGFAKRNMWRQPAGHLSVRPGLRRMTTPAVGRKWVAGFSVQNPWTLEVWHYIADVTTAGADLKVLILDENFAVWQSFDTGTNSIPRGFSHGVVEGEIMIGSPDMPTLWGIVGSGIQLAQKVASDNPSTTAIEVPRGIVSAVLNRIVIADGASLFISDPVAVTGGSPQTFVGQNQNQRPGVVFGIHEGAGGNVVVVTSAGVYSLDPSAFAVQVVGSNGTDWRMVSHAEAASYDSSCNVDGRIYALTKRGYALVDTETSEEVTLDDPMQPRLFGPRIASLDWRAARIYAGEDGPIVAITDYADLTDLASGLRSWWGCDVGSTFNVRGALKDSDGATMLLCEDGVYAIGGNVDGGQLLSSAAGTQGKGVLAGIIPTGPDDNTTVRRMQASASVGGVGTIQMAVRGSAGTPFPSSTPPADSRSMVIDTSSWGASGVIYQPTPLATVRDDTDYNTDDLAVEVAVSVPDARVGGLLLINNSDSAPKRSVHRGPP